MRNFILATAGHVDHGKSALVKALTGTDPDRLPEEKARGITIDLGFAHLELPAPPSPLNRGQSGSDQLSTFSVGVIDVPGHEDFVRNMIAGVGSIDLALLVVAANEGWMPQTEEHLQILAYLGIKRAVVALTKSDLENSLNVTDQIREKLRDTPFANAQIISTSVRTGAGLEDLKSTLAQEFAASPLPREVGKARLFVDRAFTLHGIGTVITGTLVDGTVRVGDAIFVQPRNIPARVRSLQTHGRDVDILEPGTRTAMNLPDLQIGIDVIRGNVITKQQFEASSTLDVVLTRSGRSQRAAAIKSGTSAYVHHGTSRVLTKIIFAETDSLAVGKSAVAQLRLEAPLLAFVGDRLIVRDASGQHTIAGGVVFNLDSSHFRPSQERAILASRAAASEDVDLAVWTEIASAGVIEPSRVLERSRFSAAQIEAALQRLARHGEIFLGDKVAAKMLVWRELSERAAGLIDNAHRTRPECRGLELNELRGEFSSLAPAVFDALIGNLCASDFVRVGSTIANRSHRANLPPEMRATADKLVAALALKPFDPPRRKELATHPRQQQALRFLIEQGDVVEISDDIVLLRDSSDKMRTTVSDFIATNGPATASQLRQQVATSRRVMIPYLEHLDRTGVTQRSGDLRQLRESKPTVIAPS
jgi:selenocysteine-specific elongation factor